MARRHGRHYAPRKSSRPATAATVAVAGGAAAFTLVDGGGAGATTAALQLNTANVAYAPAVSNAPFSVDRALEQRAKLQVSRSAERAQAKISAQALRTQATNEAALVRLSSSATQAQGYTQPTPEPEAQQDATPAAPTTETKSTSTSNSSSDTSSSTSRSQTRQAQAPASAPAPVASGDPRSIARSMLSSYGWGQDQFGCLNSLWIKESGWNHRAMNPSSGAYGIPQSLPGSKMASAGADWQTNPATQIKWGLGYIQGRYGSPCAAWGHSQAVGWY